MARYPKEEEKEEKKETMFQKLDLFPSSDVSIPSCEDGNRSSF
jgi:hypothetical protein